MSLQTISKLLFSQEQVADNASAIYEAVLQGSPHLRRGNFEKLSSVDLAFLFRHYDERVFTGLLQNTLEEADATPIRFRSSRRLTKNAGYTKQIKRDTPTGRRVSYEIAIAADMLLQAFNEDHREITVNGVACADRLQAMQRVFEHELIHLVEFLFWETSSCRQDRFQSLVHGIFGHTEYTHRLITRTERARAIHGIGVGERVSFSFEGSRLTGVVNRITKRATVLVESKNGQPYSNGKSYAKYYVPLDALRRVEGRNTRIGLLREQSEQGLFMELA